MSVTDFSRMVTDSNFELKVSCSKVFRICTSLYVASCLGNITCSAISFFVCTDRNQSLSSDVYKGLEMGLSLRINFITVEVGMCVIIHNKKADIKLNQAFVFFSGLFTSRR